MIACIMKAKDMKKSADYINTILQQEDIEGYIRMGAPSDEYASESAHIATAISQLDNNDITLENITAILVVEWQESFQLTEAEMLLRRNALQSAAQIILKKE